MISLAASLPNAVAAPRGAAPAGAGAGSPIAFVLPDLGVGVEAIAAPVRQAAAGSGQILPVADATLPTLPTLPDAIAAPVMLADMSVEPVAAPVLPATTLLPVDPRFAPPSPPTVAEAPVAAEVPTPDIVIAPTPKALPRMVAKLAALVPETEPAAAKPAAAEMPRPVLPEQLPPPKLAAKPVRREVAERPVKREATGDEPAPTSEEADLPPVADPVPATTIEVATPPSVVTPQAKQDAALVNTDQPAVIAEPTLQVAQEPRSTIGKAAPVRGKAASIASDPVPDAKAERVPVAPAREPTTASTPQAVLTAPPAPDVVPLAQPTMMPDQPSAVITAPLPARAQTTTPAIERATERAAPAMAARLPADTASTPAAMPATDGAPVPVAMSEQIAPIIAAAAPVAAPAAPRRTQAPASSTATLLDDSGAVTLRAAVSPQPVEPSVPWRFAAAPVVQAVSVVQPAAAPPADAVGPIVADMAAPVAPAPATPHQTAPPVPVATPAAPPVRVTAPAAAVFAPAIAAAEEQERRAVPNDAAAPADPIAMPQPVAATAAPAIVNTVQQPPLDMTQPRWPQAMVERIETLRDAAADAANAADTRIRLVPDALGAIEIGLTRDGDTIHVRFTAEQAQTRALLQEAQPRLAEVADQRGLKLGQTSVEAAVPSAQTGQQPQGQPQGSSSSGSSAYQGSTGSGLHAQTQSQGNSAQSGQPQGQGRQPAAPARPAGARPTTMAAEADDARIA